MSAWRKTPVRQRPLAWCIQETHVATVEEANTLRLEWRRIWGQDCDTDQVPMSYWSYGSSRSSGVAILLTPQAALHAAAWNEDRWNTRAITISVHDMYILHVYDQMTGQSGSHYLTAFMTGTYLRVLLFFFEILKVCKVPSWTDGVTICRLA